MAYAVKQPTPNCNLSMLKLKEPQSNAVILLIQHSTITLKPNPTMANAEHLKILKEGVERWNRIVTREISTNVTKHK